VTHRDKVASLKGVYGWLLEALADSDSDARAEFVQKLQGFVWSMEATLGSEALDELLRQLAHDLDFYVPTPQMRREDVSYFGDETFDQLIQAALADPSWSDVTSKA